MILFSMKLYLAPLNKLGNSAFRDLVLENGADFVFSEMIRTKQFLDEDEVQIRKATIAKDAASRTILQIICEEDLSEIEKSVHKLKTLNPDVLEINYNMGCPQSSLCKKENGGGILKNPEKIKKVCELFASACFENSVVPSVKTRIGVSRTKITILDTLRIINDSGIKKVYVHGRVLGEPYSKSATYDEIALAKRAFPDMEIVGNGDVCDDYSFKNMVDSGADGVMIGRCALEYPDVFEKLKNGSFNKEKSGENISDKKYLILRFLELAGKYELPDSYIKSNLSYLTKSCIGGAGIRKSVNNITDFEELQSFLKRNL